MDFKVIKSEEEQELERKWKLKENILRLLLGWSMPVSIETLKTGLGLAGLCEHYSELTGPVNELILEGRITVSFIGEGEVYFSANNPRMIRI